MEPNEKKAQELYMEYQMIDQNVKQVQKQLEALTSQMMELHATVNGLDELGKIKGESEIFVPISSGIFAKAKINDVSELLVNVGANVVVRKDVASTKKLLTGQMEEMEKIRKRMIDDIGRMANKAAQLETQLQGMVPGE